MQRLAEGHAVAGQFSSSRSLTAHVYHMMLRLHFCGELCEIVSCLLRSLHHVNGNREFLQEDGGWVNLCPRLDGV